MHASFSLLRSSSWAATYHLNPSIVSYAPSLFFWLEFSFFFALCCLGWLTELLLMSIRHGTLPDQSNWESMRYEETQVIDIKSQKPCDVLKSPLEMRGMLSDVVILTLKMWFLDVSDVTNTITSHIHKTTHVPCRILSILSIFLCTFSIVIHNFCTIILKHSLISDISLFPNIAIHIHTRDSV